MVDAFGPMEWTPDTFWRSTLTEFMLAREGVNIKNGGEKKGDGPSDDELAALVAKYGG